MALGLLNQLSPSLYIYNTDFDSYSFILGLCIGNVYTLENVSQMVRIEPNLKSLKNYNS